MSWLPSCDYSVQESSQVSTVGLSRAREVVVHQKWPTRASLFQHE